jgi:hypothetical protein
MTAQSDEHLDDEYLDLDESELPGRSRPGNIPERKA